jgi:hypothetical protein
VGTNFYWHDRPCGHCGRKDVIHVGKRSAGWSFSFRGHLHDPDDGQVSPLGAPIKSRADWAKILVPERGQLLDEYGQQVDDPAVWLAALVPPDAAMLAFETSREISGRGLYGVDFDPDEWRDAEGFRFYGREFS